MHPGLFVTGTDTGVGKTLVACALLRALGDTGKRVVGMKPVAAGCTQAAAGLRCDDVEQLRRAGNVAAPLDLVCPYPFAPAIAPHLAAMQAGATIELDRVAAAFGQLRAMVEVVVVEGVGGFRVPLNASQDTADLAKVLALPVVLVVGLRLGCLNHALLTAQAVAAAGLPLAGWVANQIDPAMPCVAENIRTLAERLPAPLLATVEYQRTPDSTRVARLLDVSSLAAIR